MGDLLKQLIESEVFKPEQDTFDSEAIHNKLDKAAEAEEVETITFGLETDDGNIVKVYVAVEDAEEFEEALSEKLGEEDDIEEVIDELSKDYDIVAVEWPDDDDDDDDDEMGDGSDSMNDKIDYDAHEEDSTEVEEPKYSTLSLGDRFKSKVLSDSKKPVTEDIDESELEEAPIDASVDDMDPKSASIEKQFNTPYRKLALGVLQNLGFSLEAIRFMKMKNPKFIIQIGEVVKDMGAAKRNLLAKAFGLNISDGTPKEEGLEEDELDFDGGADTDFELPTDAEIDQAVDDMDQDVIDQKQADARATGSEVEWTIEKTNNLLSLSNGEFTAEFDGETALDIYDALADSAVARVRDVEDNGPYIFSPRGKDYILKTPGNKEGYRLSAEDVVKVLD